jgi:peptidoglycan/LPS O-acetylase OafA/YrhL
MDSNIARAAVALVLAALLWVQSRRAHAWPKRRRAFELAAGSLLALAVLNGTLALGGSFGVIQIVVAVVGVLLLIGALVAFIDSLRNGEIRAQRERVAAAAQEYRERRAKERG